MKYQEQELTHDIIAAAIEVHETLGPGLLESAYQACLGFEFVSRNIQYKSELLIPFVYKERRVESGFRLDFLVEDAVVLELKATEAILPVHEAQLLTYLRLMNKQVGLIINFNVSMLRNGIRRLVLNASDSSSLVRR
jgi:GxxExxY protein